MSHRTLALDVLEKLNERLGYSQRPAAALAGTPS